MQNSLSTSNGSKRPVIDADMGMNNFPVLALLLMTSTCAFGQAADTAARDTAAGCTSCHGSRPSAMPALDKLSRAEIETGMLAFKRRTRAGTVMPQLAAGYSDEQITTIAAALAVSR
jgi:cytochrome subunit of sulfide dehydrogenase